MHTTPDQEQSPWFLIAATLAVLTGFGLYASLTAARQLSTSVTEEVGSKGHPHLRLIRGGKA